jgi:hypothetical protein
MADWLWLAVAGAQVALLAFAIGRLAVTHVTIRVIDRDQFERALPVTIAGAPGTHVAIGKGKKASFSYDLAAAAFDLETTARRIQVPEGMPIELWMIDPPHEGETIAVPAGTRFRALVDNQRDALEHPAGDGPLRTSDVLPLGATLRLFAIDPKRRPHFGEDKIHLPGVLLLAAGVAAGAYFGRQSVLFAAVSGVLTIPLLVLDTFVAYSFGVASICERTRDPASFRD